MKALISLARASMLILATVVLPGHPAVAQSGGEENDWNQTLAAGTVSAFDQYLTRYPAGRFASDAFRCLVEVRIDPTAEGCSLAPGNEPPKAKHVEKGHFIANIP